MIKKLLFCIVVLFVNLSSIAQFTDNFNDGNYTVNPAWSTPAPADWIVNPAFQLQSNNTTLNSNFYITTPNTLATTAQWDFYTQLSFSTSGSNYVDVFLTSSATDLTANATTGYFVRIGNTDDEVSLWRKDGVNTVKIIDGANATINSSNNILRVRVTRNASNTWNLSRDIGLTGSYISEGLVTDATFLTSAFFGVLVRQSTATFFQRHFFDDFEVKAFVPDVTPPAVVSASTTSVNTLDIVFNEPVDLVTAQQASNYTVSNGVGTAIAAVRDASNPSIVHLTFGVSFPANTNLQVTVNGVKDLSNNTLINGTASFSYFTATQYSIVIDEIMADPTPVVGLPDAEWIELKNTTGFAINLLGWRIGKPSGQSGPMPSYILKTDSFVIVCTSSAVPLLSPFGPVIPVTSFPSLSNTGDLLYLRAPDGLIVHAVNYTDNWYRNELKKDGGWTLEMIDPRNPCSGSSNWMASVDPKGGTPGKKNSVDAVNPDTVSLKLIRASASDSLNVVLTFNEPLDSSSAANVGAYSISDGINIISVLPLSVLFDRVQLRLSTPLLRNKIYTVTVSNLKDCSGNTISSSRNTARIGLYEHTDSFDIVVNEILFNPKPNGSDYVELYNRSNKILNLRNVYLANRGTTGSIGSITQLSAEDRLLFPQEFIVITEDVEAIKRDFITLNPDAFIELTSMPSYNDDDGSVIVLNEQGKIIDEVDYSEKWHFKLISNNEGVALERIDYDGASNNPDNWHSAAASVNYGTPTYKNSQYRVDAGVKGEITVSPEVFSPDNDGMDDFATIDYVFAGAGYVANVTIFDASGRPVRYLQRNTLSGIKGFYRWDGLDDKNQKLAVGIYIIYTEIFNLEGKTKKFKNTIVLARRK
ncbi:MAG: lamin tail domain-containing protein [Ferruginibacter sp.]